MMLPEVIPPFERSKGGIIDRLCQAYVVSMDNQQSGIGRIAQFFGHGLLGHQDIVKTMMNTARLFHIGW
jgi:hypothetical protein